MRLRKRHVVLLLAVALFVMATANAATSSAIISLRSTGEVGSDAVYSNSSTTCLSGEQYDARATNTLYVAAQKAGNFWTGGVERSYSVAPGGDVDATFYLQDEYHVLLDPKGPNQSGCLGFW